MFIKNAKSIEKCNKQWSHFVEKLFSSNSATKKK